MSLLVLLGLGGDRADAITETYLSDIGALLHSRTNSGGFELGTFTDETTPNRDQVIALLEMAAGDLEAQVPIEIPGQFEDAARRLVALQAGCLIEASYFPNELDTDRSAYKQYSAMYLAGVQKLIDALLPGSLRLV